jgi:transcriptional regulator with XRE-family HTH domain
VPTLGNRMAQSTHHRQYQALLELLRSWRAKAGLTQTEVGERLGNTQTFVSKVERGERRLDVVEFAEWCEALGVAPSDGIQAYLDVRPLDNSRKISSRSGRPRR